MKLIIIGPRSVGKTTLSKLLAKRLGIKHFDFDKVVDKEIKIDKTLKEYGPKEYRIRERGILIKVLKRLPKDVILDLGGGTIASQFKKISRENVKDLKKVGKFVYFQPAKTKKESIALLQKREMKRGGSKNISETTKLYSLRKPVYERICDIKILVNNKKSDSVVREIINKVK